MKFNIGIHFITAIYFWFASWTSQITIAAIDIPIEYLTEPHKVKLTDHVATTPLDDDDEDLKDTLFNEALKNNILNDGVINRTEEELICENEFVYNSQTIAHCYDDRYCKLYGDCCRNSEYYDEREQTIATAFPGSISDNRLYGCYGVNGTDLVALMIGKCPPATATADRDKCERADDFISIYPATGANTGHAYKNAYCAWCHGERRRVLYWKPEFQCRGGPDDSEWSPVRLEDAADSSLLYRDGRWYYANYANRTLSVCGFKLRQPDGTPAPRPCVKTTAASGLVDGCPAGTPAPLARACASYTYVLFEYQTVAARAPQAFRNSDCAKCNNVTANRLTCVPPPGTLGDPMPFGTLFAVKAAGKHHEPCAPDEMYDVVAAKCRNVIRDELPGACSTSAAFGPGEYDSQSFDNGTVYVYEYKQRVRYRPRDRGDPSSPATVDGLLEVCDEDEARLRRTYYEPPAYASWLAYAGVIGSVTSVVALIAHLALFFGSGVVVDQKSLPDKNLASLAVSLLLGYSGYLAIAVQAVRPGPGAPCLVSALVTQFGFLAAFAWMFVMSADVWIVLYASTKKLRVATGRRNGRYAAYSAFAWLAPAAFTALAAALQLSAVDVLPELRPNFQHDCWFRNPRSLVALFVLPAGTTIAANYVSFVGAVRLIATSGDGLGSSQSAVGAEAVNRSRKNLKIYARLSLMMGLAWVFGLAGAVTDSYVVWTLFTVFNSFQGAFIFVAFDCNQSFVQTLPVFRQIQSVFDTQTTATTQLSSST